MSDFYLTGTRNNLTKEESERFLAEEIRQAVFIPYEGDTNGRGYIVYLSNKPVQDGQAPFTLVNKSESTFFKK